MPELDPNLSVSLTTRHALALLSRLDPNAEREVFLLAALLLTLAERGETSLDLAEVAGEELGSWLGGEAIGLRAPDVTRWEEALTKSTLVGDRDDFTPLLRTGAGRYALQRCWKQEMSLADALLARARHTPSVTPEALAAGLQRHFPKAKNDPGEAGQEQAAQRAVTHGVAIISGGPGTGKTATVVRILALLLELGGPEQRIALAAPTGKAAARLRESIVAARRHLQISNAVRHALPDQVQTLHRLLGAGRLPGQFRYGSRVSLPVDVVVVDEASMVDLALFSRLLQALPATARLILLGDRDQLASVEAGAVLGDLAAVAQQGETRLTNCFSHLRHSYRFAADSGIGRLCRQINAGEDKAALATLQQDSVGLAWSDLPEVSALAAPLAAATLAGYRYWLTASTPQEALARFWSLMILCAVRKGPYGVERVNTLVEQQLATAGLITPHTLFYAGRPVMIRRNAPELDLFNGDIGLILPAPENPDRLRAFFPDSEGGVRSIAPARLPEHETVYAMTVHKSQGSEFDHILLLLPETAGERIGRELLYTAVSRGRKAVTIWGNKGNFCTAVARRLQRRSGLQAALALAAAEEKE
ncbi:MAG: exodeoxyribonuclease V subunit alpha [Desulfuromonas sp.]|nr:MAG: exodeoxyribonuclease V subunit alpha [Desulfuromonas sp.]